MQSQQLAVVPASAPRAGVPLEKQQQKAVKTRVLDHVGTYLRLMQTRLSNPSFRPSLPNLQPVLASGLELLPPSAYPQTPASSVGTKFVTSSYFRHRAAINHLIYTSDGRRLLCAGNNGNVSLWNGTNFENELGPGIQAHEASPIRCLCFSHSGLYLLSCDDMGRVKFSKPTLEVLQVYHAHKEPCRSVTFSPTDFKFATGSDDSTVRVFDTFRGQELSMTGHGGDVRWVDWHPSKGLIASCSKDACCKLWDPRSGSSPCVATLHGHKNGVFQVRWNLNGHWLLTCSRDQLVKLYDVRMLRDVATFSGHGRDVTCCAWHPHHEEVFVSGGADGSLMFWLASRPDAQGVIPTAHEATVWSVAWHPLGHVLASAGGDQKCQFWCRKRPGDIWHDVYEQDPAEAAAASFAGTTAPGLFGGGGIAAAAGAAAAAASGLLGLGPPGAGGAAAAAAAAGRGAAGTAAGGGAAAASRPNVIPGIGVVLDQLATANLQGLMASIAAASAPTAAAAGGPSGGGSGAATAGPPREGGAAAGGGAKRGRDDGGRPGRFREREREYDRERERDWERAKHPRLDGPPPQGDGGIGGGGGGEAGFMPPGGPGLRPGPGPGHDLRRGMGGGPPPQHMGRPPYDGEYEMGRGGGGRPTPPPMGDFPGGDGYGWPGGGHPGHDARRPRYPPQDGPGPGPGDVHDRYGGRGGPPPPRGPPSDRPGGGPPGGPGGPPGSGPGPGPGQGRPYGGGPPPPYGEGGRGFRGGGGGGGVAGGGGGPGPGPGGGGGGPPHRGGPPPGGGFPGHRGPPPGPEGPYGPGRGPRGPPPYGDGPGPGPGGPGGRGRGRGRGPPPPGWQGPR